MRRVVALALAGAVMAAGLVARGLRRLRWFVGRPRRPGQASPAVSPSGPVVLTLVGDAGEKQFTMNQLEALPAYTGYAGIKSSTGVITLPAEYTGVRLSDLTDLVGGITKANGVTLVAKDGYGMTFSYDQIMDHAFTAYDPATGDEQTPSKDLTVIVAYAREGKPLGEDEGPLRLMVATPAAGRPGRGRPLVGQVGRPHLGDQGLGRVEGAARGRACRGKLDKPTYVNCASPGCHGSGWVDAAGTALGGRPALPRRRAGRRQEAPRRRAPTTRPRRARATTSSSRPRPARS